MTAPLDSVANAALLPASLPAVRAWTSTLPPPVVIFNKSHSGSRLLADLVRSSGIYLGARQNESGDSEDMLELVEYVVEHYYPDFARLWQQGAPSDPGLCMLIAGFFRRHLANRENERWGWKLCETTYALPLIDYLFPQARYLHLIRDGRDVAFSNHVPPFNRFWQKVYTDAAGLRYWRGLWFGPMSKLAYRIDPLPYNVQHWINSVTVGRRFGAMLRERYMETRYEDLCLHFDREALRILSFIDADDKLTTIEKLRPKVVTNAIGKFRRHPSWQRWRTERLARPLLMALGYLPDR
jgi:Sulfotransferase family